MSTGSAEAPVARGLVHVCAASFQEPDAFRALGLL